MIIINIVVELSFYTDGDWGFGNIHWLKEHQSQYFDTDFYEYTKYDPDSHTVKCRRVFPINKTTDIKPIKEFLNRLISGIHGKEYEVKTVTDCIKTFISNIEENALMKSNYTYSDWIDGNTEVTIDAYTTDKNIPKIKRIIYEN